MRTIAAAHSIGVERCEHWWFCTTSTALAIECPVCHAMHTEIAAYVNDMETPRLRIVISIGIVMSFLVAIVSGADPGNVDTRTWLEQQLTLPNIIAIGAMLFHVAWSIRDIQWIKQQIQYLHDRIDALPETYMPRERIDTEFAALRREIEYRRRRDDV